MNFKKANEFLYFLQITSGPVTLSDQTRPGSCRLICEIEWDES